LTTLKQQYIEEIMKEYKKRARSKGACWDLKQKIQNKKVESQPGTKAPW
jgi:cytochrome c553